MVLRHVLAGSALAASLAAQQTNRGSSYATLDADGRRVEMTAHASVDNAAGGRKVETIRSINGRNVPVESSEDKIIRSDAGGRAVERVIRRYDATGNLQATDFVRLDERKNADGTTTTTATTHSADVNGNRQLAERSTTQSRKSGTTTETTTVVERPTMNGALELAARVHTVETPKGTGAQTDTTTYRRDVSGKLYPALREIKTTAKTGADESVDTAHYEIGSTGQLDLSQRRVGRTRTNPDGSQSEQVDVYSQYSAGRSGDVNTGGAPRLQEQILRDRKPGPGNTIVETTSVRARLPQDHSRFGDYEKTVRTTQLSTDAAGRDVRTTETLVGRRDPNGRLVVAEQSRESSAEPKPPAPPKP
ncbi:MAG: hypothetical protein ACRD96_11685, partial [Bryobacteraceae bacterium]